MRRGCAFRCSGHCHQGRFCGFGRFRYLTDGQQGKQSDQSEPGQPDDGRGQCGGNASRRCRCGRRHTARGRHTAIEHAFHLFPRAFVCLKFVPQHFVAEQVFVVVHFLFHSQFQKSVCLERSSLSLRRASERCHLEVPSSMPSISPISACL